MNAKQRRTRLRKHIDVIVKAHGLARLRGKPVPGTMKLLRHLEAGGTVQSYSYYGDYGIFQAMTWRMDKTAFGFLCQTPLQHDDPVDINRFQLCLYGKAAHSLVVDRLVIQTTAAIT